MLSMCRHIAVAMRCVTCAPSRSAASFGSFHLIRLLYDEYVAYLIERRVADHLNLPPIAVMHRLTDDVEDENEDNPGHDGDADGEGEVEGDIEEQEPEQEQDQEQEWEWDDDEEEDDEQPDTKKIKLHE